MLFIVLALLTLLTLLALLAFVALLTVWSQHAGINYLYLFTRHAATPPEIIMKYVSERSLKKFPARFIGMDSDDVTHEELLQVSNRQRLDGFKELHQLRLQEDNTLDVARPASTKVFIVNLTQNCERNNTVSFAGCAPAVIGRSVLWDIVQERELLPFPEFFAINGWPVVGPYADFFPWQIKRLMMMTDDQLRMLQGNGMHVSQVGKFILLGLSAAMPNASVASSSSM